MTLKDQIAADIDPVFLNLDECADEVDFDGAKIRAVVEEIRAEPFGISKTDGNIRSEGVFGRMKTLYSSVEYFPSPPLNGDRVRVDGELWTVSKAALEGGMLVLVLKAVGS